MLTEWFEGPIDVLPAVDVLGGETVRLERGDYDRVVERADAPAVLAQRYVEAGSQWVHVVDLDGARAGGVRPGIVRDVCRAVPGVRVQASGGVRAMTDVDALLAAGAERVIVGTAAVADPRPWVAAFGDRLVLALDVRDGEIRTRGWTSGTGLTLETALASAVEAGVATVLLTAIDRDGTLNGPDLAMVEHTVQAADNVDVLAAGGIRDIADLRALAHAGASAAVVGRALLALTPAGPVASPTLPA